MFDALLKKFRGKPQVKKRSASIGASMRAFNAAEVDRFNTNWLTSGTDIDTDLHYQLEPLRARSREMYANNGYFTQWVRQAKKNIIGHQGIRFQCRKRDRFGDLDEVDNAAVERSFKRFSKKGNFEITGRLSRWRAEMLIVHHLMVDGEFIVQKLPARGQTGYQVKIWDPVLLDHKLNDVNPETQNLIRLGIERDSFGTPVAYWFLNEYPNSAFRSHIRPDPEQYTRVPAEVVLHDFIQIYAQQTRGIPAAHAAILALKNLGDYRLSALIASRAGANKLGIWKTGDSGASAFEDDEQQVGDTTFKINQSEPGEIPIVEDPDAEFVAWDPTYPHQQFESFNTAMLQGIAAGLGTFHASFAQNYSRINLSSIRGGLVDERDQWRVFQRWIIEGFHEPLYDSWLLHMLRFGRIRNDAGVVLPETRFEAFLDVEWRPRGFQSPDPLKDAQANAIWWSLGVKPLQEIAADLDGSDWAETIQQIAKEKETLEELDISIKMPTFLTLESAQANNEPQLPIIDDDDEDDGDEEGEEDDDEPNN